tara:strand:+ start:16801 stop:17475 length:675 start_codon:yes stop_codon:yes gene_type:complete
MDMNSIIIIIFSFLIGSIPSAYLVGKKLKNIDLTQKGSRNTGVSNLTQNTTLYTSLPVIFFDLIIKGFLPIFLCSDLIFSLDITTKILCGMVSLIGHNWSIFLNFKGGRGIATLVGIILALDYNLFVIFTGIIAIGYLFSPIKDSAFWWIISTICTPLYTIILGLTIELTLFTFMLSFVIILKRLLSNKEETKAKISINLILLRLFFDRDIYDRKKWINRNIDK